MNSRHKKFLSYYRPYLGLLITDLLCACMVSAITLILPLCTSYITKTVLVERRPDAIMQIMLIGALMLALLVVYTTCNTFVDYQGHMMGSLMESDMRHELFAHYQTLSFSFYDEQKTGQLMTRLTNDLFSLSEFYHHGPEDMTIAVLKLVGVFVILFSINVPLTLLILCFMPCMAAYAFYFNRIMNRALRLSKDRIGDINAQVEDTLAGMRVVQSFTNEALEQQKFAYENDRFIESRRAGHRSEAYFYEGMVAFGQLTTIVVIVVGGISIVHATLSLADLLTYVLCIGILFEPLERLVNFARLYQEGITSFHRFMDLLEVPPSITEAPDAIELGLVQGQIHFNNVSFGYKAHYGAVLRDISLHIRAGEYIAFVGFSGVGKTTLCSLIPRFYDVSAGAILLDGIDIRTVRLASLRQNIGIVYQEVYLFAGTVAENIRYGKPGASDAEVIAAAKQAHAHEFIMRLPQGYATDIGQRGVKLSGGQKQRLSIARVFLKDPPIIIFDEATSSLDNESELAVQASLEALSNNRTTLVIAHRLSTVRNAQRIIVLTECGIAEQGTHAELLALNGVYASFYAMQAAI